MITNASAALQAIQGQADENGMISAESLSAVIGSLAGAGSFRFEQWSRYTWKQSR